MKQKINNEYHKIIKGYQKIIQRYKLMYFMGMVVWFWLGYIYGSLHDLFWALTVMSIIVMMYTILIIINH